jgi:hypothetical protein
LLAEDPGMIASFSRALKEGLRARQPDAEFSRILDRSITPFKRRPPHDRGAGVVGAAAGALNRVAACCPQ